MLQSRKYQNEYWFDIRIKCECNHPRSHINDKFSHCQVKYEYSNWKCYTHKSIGRYLNEQAKGIFWKLNLGKYAYGFNDPSLQSVININLFICCDILR